MSLHTFRHDERGQALFETALFMPIFILGFFSVIFAVSYSALSERVQLGVRYGGTVANIQNPYLSYSLYSMYDTIDGHDPIDVATCGGAKASIPTLIAARAALWQPVPASISAPACTGAIGEVQLGTDGGLIESSIIQLTASAPLSGYLTTRVFGTAQNEGTTSATANFFRSPDIGQLLGCSTVGAAVKTSLEGYYDNATPVTVPTPLPIALPTHRVIIFPVTCHTFGPFPAPPASVTPPPHSDTPPPAPTQPPPSNPPATASPVPTVPPTASPRPTPTASPAPTPTPTASPVPTASPSPTKSPVPTASPKPTASPVPTPTPTPTPSPSPTPIPTPPIGIHF